MKFDDDILSLLFCNKFGSASLFVSIAPFRFSARFKIKGISQENQFVKINFNYFLP